MCALEIFEKVGTVLYHRRRQTFSSRPDAVPVSNFLKRDYIILSKINISRNSTHCNSEKGLGCNILYTSNICATLAGSPAAAFYGSDTLWLHCTLLVNDPDFEEVCRVLHANSYKDVPIDQPDYRMLQAHDLDPDGKKAVFILPESLLVRYPCKSLAFRSHR